MRKGRAPRAPCTPPPEGTGFPGPCRASGLCALRAAGTRTVSLLCALLLLLTACGEEGEPRAESYDLYFRDAETDLAAGGGAYETERVYLAPSGDALSQAKALMAELLRGPHDENLKSPIPSGTSLLGMELKGRRAVVDLSAAYSSLSGVALTLADYAITLTLTQIPEIVSVQITVRGRELAYREKQIFTAQEALLSQEEDVVRTLLVTLYFPDGSGGLTPEERTLELYEGDTQVGAVARALEAGPENRDLFPALPEDFRLNSVWQEDDICYVSLSSAGGGKDETVLTQALEAFGMSMDSLETVSETRFLVDGEFSLYYGPGDMELFMDESLIEK